MKGQVEVGGVVVIVFVFVGQTWCFMGVVGVWEYPIM
jgi:hypothetical protein